MRLKAAESLLLVVDLHERLAPAICNRDEVVANARVLMQAAALLDVPILISEHCPDRLGPTLPEIAACAPAGARVRKTHFSCADEPAVVDRVATSGRRQLVVAGMEAHVCVLQTALGFRERGCDVFVVRDAVGSRRAESSQAAIERLFAAGVVVGTTEMVVFEWQVRADRDPFRHLLRLIK